MTAVLNEFVLYKKGYMKFEKWNIGEMLVQDPDGHIIRFGHRIECD